ncbi:hypothetical protein AB0K40_44410 [Nonomuraea bangladeshensis]|uniref:Uncharacterized protein n=1 Tax=Nonomuraea bangladeshensis TaxID=404385 RepID=A0ABV3HJP2_9ACTN
MVAAQTQPGRLIGGRYRLESAHDDSLDVDVAVKEVWLPSAASDEEHAQRLRRAERERATRHGCGRIRTSSPSMTW